MPHPVDAINAIKALLEKALPLPAEGKNYGALFRLEYVKSCPETCLAMNFVLGDMKMPFTSGEIIQDSQSVKYVRTDAGETITIPGDHCLRKSHPEEAVILFCQRIWQMLENIASNNTGTAALQIMDLQSANAR